ncbi:hypothetical protein [Candidatus Thiosymbion oneisti]|uniref:hypothetical protein n=1 Tax=Candidatus Thiosymbion oneisti TaxID=589554 RepID=UPI00159F2E14|nr:hypothetical protein [Candidatus Thiosymbion oneisti]
MNASNDPYDILIRGGTLIDGTGAPRRTADVAIRGERIAAVGDLAGRAVLNMKSMPAVA